MHVLVMLTIVIHRFLDAVARQLLVSAESQSISLCTYRMQSYMIVDCLFHAYDRYIGCSAVACTVDAHCIVGADCLSYEPLTHSFLHADQILSYSQHTRCCVEIVDHAVVPIYVLVLVVMHAIVLVNA